MVYIINATHDRTVFAERFFFLPELGECSLVRLIEDSSAVYGVVEDPGMGTGRYGRGHRCGHGQWQRAL